MGYKGSDPCLAKAADDEPIFVLRAQDLTAPCIVRAWVERSGLPTDHSKVIEALALADDMERWPTRKQPD